MIPLIRKTHKQLSGNRREGDRLYWHERKHKRHERLRDSVRYKKWAKWYLMSNPLCADIMGYHKEDGVCVLAKQVHHKRGLSLHPEDLCSDSQVCGVCVCCHAELERRLRT